MADIGYGFQRPSDANDDFSVVAFIVRRMMAQMSTMKLVKVLKVTGGGGAIARAGTVDVQLLVNLVDGAGNGRANAIAHGIPWWRMQGGGSAIICDPVVGDIGYVVCADRDISNVKTALASDRDPQVNPASSRSYNIADGVYVGGTMNGVPTQFVRFTSDGIVISDLNGNVIEMKSSGIEFTPAGGFVKVNGGIRATGEIVRGFGTVDQVTLGAHLHTSSGSGSPTSAPTPGT